MKTPIIEAGAIVKTYRKANVRIPVLRGIDLRMFEGEFLGVMGASGSGKSTLLNIIGCLDRPTAGSYRLDGVDVLHASDDQLSRLRSRYLGFVFQTFNLIPNLTVFENVELPFLYRSIDAGVVSERVRAAVSQVGLSGRINHRPAELSGGEMQRVAIARALAIDPKLILADEPTGNLDSRNSKEIMGLFKRLHDQGRTIILVTHDRRVAAYADSRVIIDDGRIAHESP
ncbi:MAG: ABC transporter ATP-binding protein [Desulfobacteraceae bacterium]|jgi:putative ABC transport system ATP-binding protein